MSFILWDPVRDMLAEDGVSGWESIELLPRLPRETRIPGFHVATPKNPIYWARFPPPLIHLFGTPRGTVLPLDERSLSMEREDDRRSRGLYKELSELKRDRSRNEGKREGMATNGGGGGDERRKGKGWRAEREGRAQWTASEIRKCRDPRPWIGDGWGPCPSWIAGQCILEDEC